MGIYPGEEVHIPLNQDRHEGAKNAIHIVNFGGSFSLNEHIQKDSEAFYNEVSEITSQLQAIPSETNRRLFAECVWCYEKIRKSGGLGIFCHPYWINRYRYDIPEYLSDLHFTYQPFDALELIGGYHRSELVANHLQVARYHEERSKGKRIPVVGVSDAHGCDTGELFGWYTTLVFAPTNSFNDIRSSIMELYSVAVESVPGTNTRAHGPFRLTKYAQFLLREIMPIHDQLCYEEGLQMHAFLNGDPEALDNLKSMQGRVADLYENIFDTFSVPA
jgi:hypothetical protein